MRLYKVGPVETSKIHTCLTSFVQFFLINSMFLQLSLFHTITAISLWIDQLRTSSIAFLARHSPMYYALFIWTIVVCTPFKSSSDAAYAHPALY